MPNPTQFLNGFGFITNAKFGNFTLELAEADEQVISNYHEYRYNIHLRFSGSGDKLDLLRMIKWMISGERNIKAIKNYYRCSIEMNIQSFNNDYYLVGHAYR